MKTIITSKTDKGKDALIKLSKERLPFMFKKLTATIKVINEGPLTVEIDNKAIRRTFKIAGISQDKMINNSKYKQMIINHTLNNVLSKYDATIEDFNIEVKK